MEDNYSLTKTLHEETSWSCTQRTAIFELYHEWTIRDIDLLFCREKSIQSSRLTKTIPNTNQVFEWCLFLGESNSTYEIGYSIFFCLLTPVDHEIDMKLKFSILNQENIECNVVKKTATFSDKTGFVNFITHEDLFYKVNGLVKNDTLKILFEGKGCLSNAEIQNISGILDNLQLVKEFNLSMDLTEFFENQILCDVTLSISDQDIQAHKVILASQSPVFQAMFQHETKEKQQNQVVITDIEYDVLYDMLLFMYTGKVPKLEQLAAELLEAANKYAVEGLQLLCLRELNKNISVENVVEIVTLADRYNEKNLKAKALLFIKKHALEVTNTDGWKSMIETHDHSLITEIFQSLII